MAALRSAIPPKEQRKASVLSDSTSTGSRSGSSESSGSSGSSGSGSGDDSQAAEGEGAVWVTPKEIIPIETLLQLPDSALRDDAYELSVNKHALAGWVEQQSPCCAAASLAGAFNALRHMESGEGEAMQPQTVLSILQDFVAAELAEKRASTARALGQTETGGAAALALLLCCVEHLQTCKGRPIIGRKDKSVSSADLRSSLRECAVAGPPLADGAARALLPPDLKGLTERHEAQLWQRLRKIYDVPQPKASPAAATSATAPATASAPAAAPAAAAPAAEPTGAGALAPATAPAANAAAPASTEASAAGVLPPPPPAVPALAAAAPPAAPPANVKSHLLKRAAFEKFGVTFGAVYPDGPALIMALTGVAARSELKVCRALEALSHGPRARECRSPQPTPSPLLPAPLLHRPPCPHSWAMC